MKQTFDQFTHELNNTFSVVKINSELLISSLRDEKLMRFAARIKHNNDQAIELVTKYGQYIELRSDAYTQESKDFFLQDLINGVVENRDIKSPDISEEILIHHNRVGLQSLFSETIELVERSVLTVDFNQLNLELDDKHVKITICNATSNAQPLLIKNQKLFDKLEKLSIINQYSVGIILHLSNLLNAEVIINNFNNDFIIQISFQIEMFKKVCHGS